MDVSQAISTTRSVRAYQNQDIEEEKLKTVLEAGRLAPSASNEQEWKFIIVKDYGTRQRLSLAASHQAFIATAPVIIVACATGSPHVMKCGQPAQTVDLSIAMSFMILQATELGLGTCWIGSFDESEVKLTLGIPKEVRVIAITPLGYPDRETPPKPRKTLDQVVSYDRFL